MKFEINNKLIATIFFFPLNFMFIFSIYMVMDDLTIDTIIWPWMCIAVVVGLNYMYYQILCMENEAQEIEAYEHRRRRR